MRSRSMPLTPSTTCPRARPGGMPPRSCRATSWFSTRARARPASFRTISAWPCSSRGAGVYADLDVYCVRPIEGPPDYLMAYERPGSINGAVLHIPADAPLLDDLLAIFTRGRAAVARAAPAAIAADRSRGAAAVRREDCARRHAVWGDGPDGADPLYAPSAGSSIWCGPAGCSTPSPMRAFRR